MIGLLSRWFIRDRDNVTDPRVRRAYGQLCGFVGIGLNILLFAGKFFAGTLSGSVAITADAFNNLSDAGSSVVTLLGFRLAGKKPDPQHPFGHGRLEYVSGLIVAGLILLMGVELAKSSFDKILHPEEVAFSALALGILAASVCVKLYMWLYNRRIGRRIKSAAMEATAMDSLSDTAATAAVLLAMLIGKWSGLAVDGYVGLVVALFILLFNLIGKVLVILRIQNNFKLVSSEKLKHAAVFLKDRNLLREISRGLSMEEYTIAYPETSPFLSNFLDNSYSEDHAEHMSRILAPVCLLAGIILSVLSYLFNKDVAEAVSTFTAIMCVSAPLTSTIAANLPLYRMSAKLIPAGAMVSGYSAVDAFSRTEAVVLDAKDLFRPSDIILHGIKPFDKSQIDSVILDAASVVCNTDGMLTDVFNKIIGSNRSMLRPVENVTYEDSMGLSAWVDGKRVLIGNRELMVNHGIEIPSNDYETRFVRDRKNIIYLANSAVRHVRHQLPTERPDPRAAGDAGRPRNVPDHQHLRPEYHSRKDPCCLRFPVGADQADAC